MRKVLAGRRGLNKGVFKIKVDTTIQTNQGQGGTASNTRQFYFPIFNGTDRQGYAINFTIDWGDGSTSDINPSNYSTACLKTYASGGVKTIQATGSIAGFGFWAMSQTVGKADGHKLTEILEWGDLKLTGGTASGSPAYTRVGQCFRSCINLTKVSAPDAPWFPLDSNGITLNSHGARALFMSCSNLTTINNIKNWYVGSLNSSTIMFEGCTKLEYGTNANGAIDLQNWDLSRVSILSRMFSGCSLFDTKMPSNIGSNILGFQQLQLTSMFQNCGSFTNLNTGSMNSWNVKQAINMQTMFNGCTSFNDNIAGWDTSAVTNMRSMFENCTVFNQSISSWDTSAVTDMRRMLTNCSAFDQNIGNWNVNAWVSGSLSDFPLNGPSTSFSLSTANYDALLNSWNGYSFPNWAGVVVDFGNSTYSLGSSAAVARVGLVAKWGGINDGGGV